MGSDHAEVLHNFCDFMSGFLIATISHPRAITMGKL